MNQFNQHTTSMPDLQNAMLQHQQQQRQLAAAQQLAQGGNGWGGIGEVLGAALGAYKSNKLGSELDKSGMAIESQLSELQAQQQAEIERIAQEKAEREYQRKKADDIEKWEREQGGRMDIAKYKVDNAKSNAPVVNVNSGEVSSEFQKKMAGANATKFNDWEQQAFAANESMANIQKMQEISQLQATGKGQEAMAMVTQYFGSDAGANMQSFNALSKRMVLNAAEKLSGAMSDGDIALLESQIPNFGNDPRANEMVMGIISDASQRSINRYQDASKYVEQNGKLQGFKPSFEFSKNKGVQMEKEQEPQAQTVLNGKNYVQIDGQWFEQ